MRFTIVLLILLTAGVYAVLDQWSTKGPAIQNALKEAVHGPNHQPTDEELAEAEAAVLAALGKSDRYRWLESQQQALRDKLATKETALRKAEQWGHDWQRQWDSLDRSDRGRVMQMQASYQSMASRVRNLRREIRKLKERIAEYGPKLEQERIASLAE